jgi:predicted acetyltransferase
MRAVAPQVYERFRRSQPGAIARRPHWWDVRLGMVSSPQAVKGPKPFFALYRDGDGAVDGYIQYRVNTAWNYRTPDGVVQVDELVAVTDEAYAALWRHCVGLDLVKKVTAENRPPVEPLPWLLSDQRAARQRERADLLWVRLLDIPSALMARSYRVEDRIVIEVCDPWLHRTLRLALNAGAASVTCDATDDPAELSLGVAELGAAYLGGTPLWPAAAAGRVTEHRPGAVASFDRLFGTSLLPWCGTWF